MRVVFIPLGIIYFYSLHMPFKYSCQVFHSRESVNEQLPSISYIFGSPTWYIFLFATSYPLSYTAVLVYRCPDPAIHPERPRQLPQHIPSSSACFTSTLTLSALVLSLPHSQLGPYSVPSRPSIIIIPLGTPVNTPLLTPIFSHSLCSSCPPCCCCRGHPMRDCTTENQVNKHNGITWVNRPTVLSSSPAENDGDMVRGVWETWRGKYVSVLQESWGGNFVREWGRVEKRKKIYTHFTFGCHLSGNDVLFLFWWTYVCVRTLSQVHTITSGE